MNFQQLFDFLERLNANNHKDWMDANRDEYHQLKQDLYEWLLGIDKELVKVDPDYYPVQSKRSINRINNNLLFHPNYPVYKDHFGMGLDQKPGKSDFYIHLGIEECFLAGGFYKPKKSALTSIRDAIDYDGEKLVEILSDPLFKKNFSELTDEDKLTNPPKGFAKSHPHIDLLKHKNFAIDKPISKKFVLSTDFKDEIINTYKAALPFRKYLNHAVSV